MSRLLAVAGFLCFAAALPSPDAIVPESTMNIRFAASPSFPRMLPAFLQEHPSAEECQQCCQCPDFPGPTPKEMCSKLGPEKEPCEQHCASGGTCHSYCIPTHSTTCEADTTKEYCQGCCNCPNWPGAASQGACFGDPQCVEHCKMGGTCQQFCTDVTCDAHHASSNMGGSDAGPCDRIDPEKQECCKMASYQEQAECILKDHGPCDLVDPNDEQCCKLSGKVEQAACYCMSTSPQDDFCCSLQDHGLQAACLAGMNLAHASHITEMNQHHEHHDAQGSALHSWDSEHNQEQQPEYHYHHLDATGSAAPQDAEQHFSRILEHGAEDFSHGSLFSE